MNRMITTCLALALGLMGLLALDSSPCAAVQSGVPALEPYQPNVTRRVLADLVAVSPTWSSYRMNAPGGPGVLGVYLLNSDAMPANGAVALAPTLQLRRAEVRDTALAHHETRSVVIDTRMLKSLMATANLTYGPRRMSVRQAAGVLRAQGLSAHRASWARGDTTEGMAAIAYRGALALVLAHEMGHLEVGPRVRVTTLDIGAPDTDDRKVYSACPQLIDPEYRQRQAVETDADQRAVRLLSQVCPHTGDRPRFRYELGAHFYFSWLFENALLDAASVSQSPRIQQWLSRELGAPIARALMVQGGPGARAMLDRVFTTSHPAPYRRITAALQKMAQSSCSAFQGEIVLPEARVLETLIKQECSHISARIRAAKGQP